MDRAALKAQAFARTAMKARDDGYRPDVVVAHSGWGAGMFVKDIFPDAKFIAYCEWWYRFPAVDVTYLTRLGYSARTTLETPLHERARNAPIAMDLAAADLAVCPTAFQAAQFPEIFRQFLTVLHEGVDTDYFRPRPASRRSSLCGLVAEDARVVTYATRGMEPHRGFPQFIAALPRILSADPNAIAVVAGENRVFYGGDALRHTDWKSRALKENDIDPARVRFVGRLARNDYLALLQRSDAHAYLTVPFVLSWSMLEAMSAGCAMVLSDTEPVREFAAESTATMVDMSDPGQLSDALIEAMAGGVTGSERRSLSREFVKDRVCADKQMSRWQELL